MSSQQVLTIAQAALHMLLMTAAPILLVVLLVGLIVSILQAVTQINENTLSFIPKLVAALVVLIFIGPWLISTYVDYLREVLLSIPGLVG
ncbi:MULTISPECIES: flagellar biosynthesis protein FliQ [unclassified Acidovorax]|jgi:flagellar biosynthetic protein FliQ|uniref:flagellar biosynthesis protein FliQ n=1 Tax=unclassified Acidovorax TaxID=2684926 RepID=UPI000D3981EC|nr:MULTISPECIES: flagellar biosynthesis protein FliQ [unclassified Acidovorax]MBL7091423.1 flagellar biosynthesis protein FliQ [Acidovorax sp.]MBQ1558074.1 flagellar biosynthesis protein FliQ [Pseudomonas sp.]PTT41087.1 flagellar biosynthetic protein FliQ [Acidovorax sp. HMWF018]